ncbi:unnamed protein product [Lactuca saligna]|uniref:NAC domain-containing protein n=1 Tax=Lactuca saligna TaxID=75948 RepID=A0AA36EE01_LACSI|nr:unnamed protein product [Lactuca saligna]
MDVALDFADQLPSYYRFCPTDSELIIDCLNAKLESREPPKCRLHEVNVYNHTPEQLTEQYRSHENKWYFLTSRDRKYLKGNRPDRALSLPGKHGCWKTTEKLMPVYDATSGQMVGHKGTLTYFENGRRTMWVMHEYTINGPNLPFENGDKLSEWVLCKIYKRDMEEPKIPLRKRRRVSENDSDSASSSVSIEPPASSAQPLDDGAYTTATTEHGLISIKPMQIRELCYHTNMLSLSTPSDGFLFSNGALNSSSMEPLIDCIDYPPVLVQNSCEDAPTQLDVQNICDQNDAADDFHVHDDSKETTISAPVEVEWSFKSPDCYSDQSMVVPQDDAAGHPKTQLNVQTCSNHHMVDVPQDDAVDHHIPLPDGNFNANIWPLDDADKLIMNTVSLDFKRIRLM